MPAPRSLWQRLAPAVLVAPVLVAIVAFAAFSPALSHGWMERWDDDHNFLWNERYRGLGMDQLEWAFQTTLHGPYQPLSWLSAGLDYEIHGMDAAGYHLTNLLLHALAAVLCYRVVLRLLLRVRQGADQSAADRDPPLQTVFAAACGALLFAVHPLRVESVAWITERRDVLSGVFYLATLAAYLRYTDRDTSPATRPLAYAATVAAFAAAVLSKATGMLLPAALLVLDVYPLRRIRFEALLPLRGPRLPLGVLADKLPLFAISGFAAVMAWQGQQAAGTFGSDLPVHVRLAIAVYGVCFYPLKTLLPLGLSPMYELGRPDPTELRFIASAVAAVGVTALVIARRRAWPAAFSAWAFYVILALPILGLFQAGSQIAADRYSYLPCLPIAALGAYAVTRLRGGHAVRFGMPLLVIAAVVTLTVRQTQLWESPHALWTHAAALDPDNSEAHLQLGLLHLDAGRHTEAEAHLSRSTELRDDQASVWTTLGALAGMRGDHARAAQCFRRALELDPLQTQARENLQRAIDAQALGTRR